MFNSIKVHQSLPPLRWIANLAGEISGWAILKAAYLDEEENFGLRYKVYGKLFTLFNPISAKYGTHYLLNMEMSGKGWDDYDEDGIPYWEKYKLDWDFQDISTGDAFRVIQK